MSGAGMWVIVCGPSGAGKDSALRWAAGQLATHRRICFARRLVTRPPGAGADDDAIGLPELQALRARGALAWHWQAHGLHYGIASDYQRRVAAGEVVVVNGSREHARQLAGHNGVRCVLVTAPAPLVAERLRRRGREDEDGVALRVARNAELQPPAADRVIVNDGRLEQAGVALRDYLLELAE
ncbi:phosphonate metabolism protein/1,5-bisphosphokinase (PRPP-forming) PhnN [Ramlibacter sp. G-1-2-2]|uniref:Phosphonate metabolism protein/1,5-bisphosphokinase (PRPP-forming) PhnN n=1 Tax=Ramlibacter agri TaxID=2728837 RepID=A0A848H4D8_9BURK|nr:phosphonate metabolism protein/1,5-bisphosphokinase (PRPP-forming) PhnN [Ramlibacter agri]NML42618.1 phosphonate metabolism protein/1,5-bisphosphokinase (PRPP-forming) PhnN [Ramlibacter agri]